MRQMLALLGAAAAVGLTLAPAVRAEDVPITAQTVVDRAQIEDLLQRYYNNFGKAEGDSFASFYAADAEFVLGAKTYKGQDEIAGAYKAVGASGQNPAAGRFSFNVLMTNPVITVRGDTATAQIAELQDSGYAKLHKPVAAEDLRRKLVESLQAAHSEQRPAHGS